MLHWAPSGSITNAKNYVQWRAIETVPGRPLAISSDLSTFDDWITVRVLGPGGTEISNVTLRIVHKSSAARPKFFVAHHEPVAPFTNPPLPGLSK